MRDALGRLEQEGLITILPKKGLMVSGITEEDVHSMFEMRLLGGALRPAYLRQCHPREQLEAYAELMHHSERIEDFCKSDDDFHELLMSTLPNKYLRSAYDRITMAGMEMATATMMAETSFMAAAGTLNRSATATIKRYRQLPNTTPRMRRSMVRLPTSVSPMMREASAMVTMPVPTLISQLFWYCASSPPDSAHNAPDTHRPTVMVKAGVRLEARTMAALSPVARMESPSPCPESPASPRRRWQ